MSIPVICDRCRSPGNSGEGDFSHLGDLLDFTPVPRKNERVDGWHADKQRAFIAALAATGSKRRAAMSLGMAAYGIDQMLKSEGNESFKAAYERAMAIARQNGTMKIAQGVADAAARNAQLTPPSRLRGHAPEPEASDMSDEFKLEIIESICRKYFGKARQEREARLSGEIVAADFYLRQMTVIEVGLDLAATDVGVSGFEMLKTLQRDGHDWMHIAETPFSRALDEERRRHWGLIDEPERPEPTPRRYLEDRGDYSLEPSRSEYGALTTPAEGFTEGQWAEMKFDEQRHARQAEWARAAAEQLEWEAKARRDFEARSNHPLP